MTEAEVKQALYHATRYDQDDPTPAETFDWNRWYVRWLSTEIEEQDEGWPKTHTGVGPTIAA